MKQIITIMACLLSVMIAFAKPQCQGFNNYDYKVTIVFTDDTAESKYDITDV